MGREEPEVQVPVVCWGTVGDRERPGRVDGGREGTGT